MLIENFCLLAILHFSYDGQFIFLLLCKDTGCNQ